MVKTPKKSPCQQPNPHKGVNIVLLKVIVGVLLLAIIGTSVGLVRVYLNFQESQAALLTVTTELQASQATLDSYREMNQSLSDANKQMVVKIQEQAQRNLHLEAVNNDLTAESRRIYQEVQRVDELNTSLGQEIQEVTDKNNSLNREIFNLTVKKDQIEADNVSLRHELDTAVENTRALQVKNEQQTLNIQTLEQEKASIQEDVQNLQQRNQTLDEHNKQQESTIQALEREETTSRARITELQGQNRSLRQLNDTLQSKSGSVTQLNNRIDSLRAEIRRLEDQRKPLLLQTERSNFACTGSMEPKLTCLDSATYLENFLPQDITVGTIIAFDPPATCRVQSNRGIVHRVERVKVERGIYYYWPKGDNAERADDCWVSERDVSGYIIEVHKNTRPERAELRNFVNSADAEAERARNAYFTRRASYGCHSVNQVCRVSSRSQLNELNRLRTTYIAAADYHWCWVQAAKNAQYSLFRKPVHSICIK